MALRSSCFRCLVAALVSLPLTGQAQIRASEMGSTSQVIDGTKVTIQYSRPRTRGRAELFGARAVPWDEMWTPGANWATTLTTTKDVTLNGQRVAKGTWGVWMVPHARGPWDVILEPEWHRFHMNPPDSSARQVRLKVNAEAGPATDVLTWSFPELRVNGGTLAMQWATTRVAMDLRVEPSLPITLPEPVARAYVGSYIGTDATHKFAEKWDLVVSYEHGVMKARFDPNDEYLGTFAMILVAPDTFAPGLHDEKGEIYEVLRPDMMITFKRVNGRVVSFEIRNDRDELESTGRRRP